MRAAIVTATLLVAAVNTACDPDNCADLPASFHLDIEIEDKDEPTRISLLRVDIESGEDHFRRYFEVGDAFSDGKTSIGVELEPAPVEETDIVLTVAGYITTSTATPPADEQTSTVELEPNGCNRYRFELEI